MRVVVQRVNKAKVTLRQAQGKPEKVVGEIKKGFLVLVGFRRGDTEEQVNILADKLTKLRVMADSEDKMNLSLNEAGGSVLVVSQFTLYADTSGGNRPSFIDAEDPSKARILYDLFVAKLRQNDIKVETGSFGDYMKIETEIDGPVTILYEN
jgi:D-tyrosyl-tRNA(Tyr) deacylase